MKRKKAAKPKHRNLFFRAQPELITRLQTLALEEDRPLSRVIRRLVLQSLEQSEKTA
jgi:predicted transcriptional regulator